MKRSESLTAIAKDWWGLCMPLVVFFVSDMGLPDDAPPWVTWLAAGVSVVSYIIGRVNGSSAELIGDLRDTIAGKDAAIKREKERNAELSARWELLNSDKLRVLKEIERMTDYQKSVLGDMYQRHMGYRLVVNNVENPYDMPLVRKGIVELSEVSIDEFGNKYVTESLTLLAYEVIKADPSIVGLDSK